MNHSTRGRSMPATNGTTGAIPRAVRSTKLRCLVLAAILSVVALSGCGAQQGGPASATGASRQSSVSAPAGIDSAASETRTTVVVVKDAMAPSDTMAVTASDDFLGKYEWSSGLKDKADASSSAGTVDEMPVPYPESVVLNGDGTIDMAFANGDVITAHYAVTSADESGPGARTYHFWTDANFYEMVGNVQADGADLSLRLLDKPIADAWWTKPGLPDMSTSGVYVRSTP